MKTMKNIAFAAFALLSTAAFVACGDTAGENHGTTIYNRGNNSITEMYADQTVDSLHVISYDSWTSSIESILGGDWCTTSVSKCEVPAYYVVTQSVIINTTPNTTGLSRVAMFNVRSSWVDASIINTPIYQYGWLNISTPMVSFTSKDIKDAKAEFKHDLKADATAAPLAFYVFGEASLTSDAEWLTIPESVKKVEPGSHGVQLTVTPNNTASDRVANVTLTSNGVSNVITYTQKAKK